MITSRLLTVIAAAGVFSVSAAHGAVFEDNFDNGIVADSDDRSGFWTDTSSGATSSITEAGGSVMITAHPGDSGGGASNRLQSGTHSEFNFFNQELNFSTEEFAFTGTADNPQKQFFQLLLTPDGQNSNNADDLVELALRGPAQNTIELAVGTNLNNGGETSEILATSVTGEIQGFSLTLAGNADGTGTFSLTITHADGSNTFDGDLPLNAADWGVDGNLDGDTAIGLRSQVVNAQANGTGEVTLGDFTVVPEPASLSLLGLGGLLMATRRRARR